MDNDVWSCSLLSSYLNKGFYVKRKWGQPLLKNPKKYSLSLPNILITDTELM